MYRAVTFQFSNFTSGSEAIEDGHLIILMSEEFLGDRIRQTHLTVHKTTDVRTVFGLLDCLVAVLRGYNLITNFLKETAPETLTDLSWN